VLEVPEPAHPLKTRAIAARAERDERDFIIRFFVIFSGRSVRI
jgi:hypothetical protein